VESRRLKQYAGFAGALPTLLSVSVGSWARQSSIDRCNVAVRLTKAA
jgi:hypothetical protein